MADSDKPVYCAQCGSIAQAGDRFCGVCGTAIPPDAQDAAPTREVSTRVPAPPPTATRVGNRTIAAALGLGAAVFLVLIVVAFFAMGVLGGERGEQSGAGGASVRGGPTSVPAVGDNPTPAPTSSLTEELTMPYGEESEEAEADVEQAARDYYEAVDRKDWAYTYENLDSETRVLFTEEEWRLKNRWFADNEDLELESMGVEAVMDLGGQGAEVTVERTFEDGTTLTRETYFVREGGEWTHHFTDEEKDIFMPGVPYEEFVTAQ